MKPSELLSALAETDEALQRKEQEAAVQKSRREWLRTRAQGYVAEMTHIVGDFTGFVKAVAPKKSKGTSLATTGVVLARDQTFPKLGRGTAVAVVLPFSARGGLATYANLSSVNKVVVAFTFMDAGMTEKEDAISFAADEIYDVAAVSARTELSFGYHETFQNIFEGILDVAQNITHKAHEQSTDTLDLLYRAARDAHLNRELAAQLNQRVPMPASLTPGV